MRALDALIRLSGTPHRVRRVPPTLGEHTAEILAEHGYDPAAIDDLRRAGVLR